MLDGGITDIVVLLLIVAILLISEVQNISSFMLVMIKAHTGSLHLQSMPMKALELLGKSGNLLE